MSEKIFPRNLTARAAHQVPGNPVVTRLEGGVGNCYPGLEFDQRNLDRRFFPGLVFEFVDQSDNPRPNDTSRHRQGARLLNINTDDPDFAGPGEKEDEKANVLQELKKELGNLSKDLKQGRWFIDQIEQGGKRISLHSENSSGESLFQQGLVVWRLVRCLEPDAVTITLKRRDKAVKDIVLKGWRRTFVNPVTGVISDVYDPGELSQTLCSPWMHDFRDCGCHYWASNHPDIVLGQILPGEPTLPDGLPADPTQAHTPLDWLRTDRSPDRESSALDTKGKNRPFQMDHYQINLEWEKLATVLQREEVYIPYTPRKADISAPYPNDRELVKALQGAAKVELLVAVQYLYAMYSLLSPEEVPTSKWWPTMKSDVIFVRHYLNLIAVSEMTHLRWANQMLWELYDKNFIDEYEPVLKPPLEVRVKIKGKTEKIPAKLDGLTKETLNYFIAIEEPHGVIDSTYSRIVSTLRGPRYPKKLEELAVRIVTEGMEHYSRFRDIKKVLMVYSESKEPYPYLRDVKEGSPEQAKEAIEKYKIILENIKTAYNKDAMGKVSESNPFILDARTAMNELNDTADTLAAKGIGVPFLDKSLYGNSRHE